MSKKFLTQHKIAFLKKEEKFKDLIDKGKLFDGHFVNYYLQFIH